MLCSFKNKCNAALHVCRIFFLPSKGHLCGVALDFSNNRVAFFLYCVIINIIGSGSSLNRNLTDCTGPHAPSEGVGRPKGGLGVVPTRNFTDLLVQLQIRNNPPVSLADLWKWRWTRCPIACTAIGYLPQRSLIIRTVPGLPTILPILLARMDGLCPTSMPIPAAPLPAALDLAMLLFMAAACV